MKVLSITLVTDGSSDRALIPIVEWLVAQKLNEYPFQVQLAEALPKHGEGLKNRILYALTHYSCDILIIHRDAEGEDWSTRFEEINQAISTVAFEQTQTVAVIPIRMTEAWLLFDEMAVRRAAGNPAGKNPIKLSSLKKWEKEIDPKQLLLTALRDASELSGRRLAKFNPYEAKNRVAYLIRDFSVLNQFESFCHFKENLELALQSATS